MSFRRAVVWTTTIPPGPAVRWLASAGLAAGSHTVIADFRHYADRHRLQAFAHIAAYEEVDHLKENHRVALA